MLDALIFGPHPDDIEICAGGLALVLHDRGYKVGGVDMTRGESGTRGATSDRLGEARRGAGLLGLELRECLGLPDGAIETDRASRDLVIDAIRRHRPRIVVAPWVHDDHPDHARTGRLVKEARFLAGCARVGPGGEAWRPGRVLFYPSREALLPSLVVDISDVFARKMAAIRAHASQLHDPGSSEPATTISSPGFLEAIEAGNRYFGAMIGAVHGEPFLVEGPLAVGDPMELLRSRGHGLFARDGAAPSARPGERTGA